MSESLAITGVRRQIRELVDGSLEIKIHIQPYDKKEFHRLFPEIDMPVAIAPMQVNRHPEIQKHEEAKPEKQPNKLAKAMHVDGYFRNPKLWTAMEIAEIYTQDHHKKFIESLPCCGTKFAKHIACNGDVVGHHVKTSENSGVGIKPLHWYLVPLCHAHHMTWAHGSHAGSATHEDRHDALIPHAVSLTADQMKEQMKRVIGIESLSEITRDLLNIFEEEFFGDVVNKYGESSIND